MPRSAPSALRILALTLCLKPELTYSQLTATGNVFGINTFQSPTWDAGNLMVVGSGGNLTVNNGGLASSSGFANLRGEIGAPASINVNGGTLLPGAIFTVGGSGGDSQLLINDGLVQVLTPDPTVPARVILEAKPGTSSLIRVSGGTFDTGENIDVGVFYQGSAWGQSTLEITGGTVISKFVDFQPGQASVSGGTWQISNELILYSIGSPHLDIFGNGVVAANAISNESNLTVRESGSLTGIHLTNTMNGEITVGGSGSIAVTDSLNNGLLSLHGFGSFSTNALTNNGDILISGGSMSASSVVAAFDSSAEARIELNSGGTLTTGNVVRGNFSFNFATQTLELSAGSAFLDFDGGTLRLTRNQDALLDRFQAGSVTLATGGGTIDTQSFAVSSSVGLIGSGGLTKSGTGTLTLRGANAYTGGTTVGEGTLAVTGSIHHPDSNLDVNGTLRISGNGSVTNRLGRIGRTSPGRVEISGGTWDNAGGVNIGFSRDSTMEMTGGHVTVADTVFLGSIFTASATGTLQLNGGMLTAPQVAEGAGGGTVAFDGGTLRLSGNQSNLFGTFEFGEVTLGNSGGTIHTQEFNVASGYRFSGAGGLTKSGTGTLTLSGASTYAGRTRIEAGTLTLGAAGSLQDSLGIDVASGATFDVSGLAGGFTLAGSQTFSGHGTIRGNVTTVGAIAPGNSTGELLFAGDLTLALSAMPRMELASSSDFDRIIVEDQLAYGGTLAVGFLDGYLPETGATFQLFEGFSSHSGTFDQIDIANPGYTASFNYGAGELTLIAIPEPSSSVFLATSALATCMLRRRRTRSS